MTPSVLFVCLGNICRSPLAEAAMRRQAEEAGIAVRVDSAGTGDWHVGSPPDRRAIAVARLNGIDISNLRARQVKEEDFSAFDHIVALDRDNLLALETMAPPGARARLSLLLDHVDERRGQPVADPYYGGEEHFSQAWRDVWQGTGALLRVLAGGR